MPNELPTIIRLIIKTFIYYPLLASCLWFGLKNVISRKTNSHIILLIILLSIVSEILGKFNLSSIFIANTYFALLYLLTKVLVSKVVVDNKIKNIFIITSAISLILVVTSVYNIETKNRYNQLCYELVNISIVFDCILFYADVLKRNEIILLRNYQEFWIISSLFLWNLMNVFRIGILYYLSTHDRQFLLLINLGFTVINVVTYTLFLKGLLCQKQRV